MGKVRDKKAIKFWVCLKRKKNQLTTILLSSFFKSITIERIVLDLLKAISRHWLRPIYPFLNLKQTITI